MIITINKPQTVIKYMTNTQLTQINKMVNDNIDFCQDKKGNLTNNYELKDVLRETVESIISGYDVEIV